DKDGTTPLIPAPGGKTTPVKVEDKTPKAEETPKVEDKTPKIEDKTPKIEDKTPEKTDAPASKEDKKTEPLPMKTSMLGQPDAGASVSNHWLRIDSMLLVAAREARLCSL